MRFIRHTVLFCGALLAQASGQTKNAAEQLGFPANTKLLIIHADDLAVSHSSNKASFAALDSKAVSAASIMVPCPWLTEVGEYAKAHPDTDLGLHLTLTSEWKTYRWGPVSSTSLVPGLLDPSGFLWPDSPFVQKNATPAEVETELRAQIDRARKAGIRPTHVDSHMAVLFSEKYFPTYVKVARENSLPFMAIRPTSASPAMLGAFKDTDILPQAIMMAMPGVKPDNWGAYYAGLVRGLKPGLSEIIVHLGYDDAELQAVSEGHPAYGSAWRQRDFNVMTSPEFKRVLDENHVVLTGWKQIQEKEYGKPR